MGNFQSTRTRFLGCRTPDEEEGGTESLLGYPNLQNQYKSNEDSSVEILLFFSSIYKATKAILQKALNVVVSTKAADPSLPIQNPSPHEPLLASSLHSLSVDTVGSLTGLISDEEAQHENVDHVVSVPEIRCSNEIEVEILPIQNPSPHEPLLASSLHSLSVDTVGSLTGLISDEEAQHENVDRDHVVSVPEISCSNEIQVEISPCLEIKSSRKARKKVKRSIAEKRIKHYSSRHNILLVGEGDFSFSACLALAFGSAANIIATSLDSQAFLKKNYGNAMSNIAELRRRAGKVMHGIDATKMANHKLLGKLKFDRIIYNFPYAGIFDKSVPRESQLSLHRKLVSKFLMNAKNMISEYGEIHITHKTNSFHADFKVESIASSHGLRLIEAVEFNRGDYPGYNNKYGFGGDANFDCKLSKTFKFGPKSVSL